MFSYNFENGKWERVPPQSSVNPEQRYGHSVALYEDKIYMFGGLKGKVITDELWELHLSKYEWTLISQDMIKLVHPLRKEPLAVVGHTAHVIEGTMYVFFGHSPEYGYMNTVQLFQIGKLFTPMPV